jgi:glucosylceramidase
MTLTAQQELSFINNNLGPKIRGAGYNTKIIGFDHNCDNTSYPTTVANGSSYVDGSAFHLYSGSISALTTVKNATNKNVYFTEQWTSSAGNFGGDLSWHTQNVTIGAANNWAKAIFEWNLANNSSMGPHTPGGCTQCLGALTVNNSTSVTRNVAYYIIAHLSKFVNVNAVRIGATSNHGNLISTAFRNPDGSKVAVVLNNSGGSLTFRIVWNNQSFTYSLAAGSVVSFKWSGTGTPPPTIPINSIITLKGNNNMFVSGENGTQVMHCNRATAGDWEKFAVIDAGNGKIGLRSMGKFVSSENGAASGITCNRTTIGGTGSWEHFDWVVNADGKISFRGNNGMYITSNNGVGAMTCDRASISGWEAFTYAVVGTARMRTEEETLPVQPDFIALDKLTKDVNIYPNPSNGNFVNVKLIGEKQSQATIQILDSKGETIWKSVIKDPSEEFTIEKNLKAGLYHVQIIRGNEKTLKRIVVE